MSKLVRSNDQGFICIFGKETRFCDDKLRVMDFEQYLAYMLVYEEKYDLVLFYHEKGGIRFVSKDWDRVWAEITGKSFLGKQELKPMRPASRGRKKPLPLEDPGLLETQREGVFALRGRNALEVFETLLNHAGETDKEIIDKKRAAIVLTEVDGWFETAVENLKSFFNNYSGRSGHDLFILCFKNFTPSEAWKRYENSPVIRYLTEWESSLDKDAGGKYKNIIQIEAPSQEEVKNLLNRKRLIGELELPASQLNKLTEEVYKYSRKEKESLGSLFIQIENYCRIKGIPAVFDRETFSNVFKTKISKTSVLLLEELVGMESIKSELESIRKIIENANVNKIIPPYRSRFDDLPVDEAKINLKLHFALKGNPGTGKSTVARLLGAYLCEIGALSSGHVEECLAKDLIAGYIGQTAIKTSERVERANGGVLFIDEISGIVGDSKKGLNGNANGFAKDVNGVLLGAMTGNPDLSVIIAGYPDDIDAFFESDNGYSRRIGHIITLPDYNEEQLADIFRLMAKKEGYTIAPELEEILNDFMDNWLQLKPYDGSWGNAGEIENLFLNHIKSTIDNDKIIKIKDIPEKIQKNKVCYDLVKCIRNCGKNKPPPEEELNDLTGLEEVKAEVKEQEILINHLVKRGDDISDSLNFLFLGNPGTGKTTVARLMGKILARIGALQYSKVIETGPKELVDRTQGEERAKNIFKNALGGVLFIDEAYGLLNESGGMSVITELIAFSENNRGKLCIILAGYSDDMKRLIAVNDGFASRFQTINFANYSPDELIRIFDKFCKSSNYAYEINGEFSKLLQAYIEHLSAKSSEKGFGNAREMRELFRKCRKKLAARTIGTDANKFLASDIFEAIPNIDVLIKKNKPEYMLPSMDQMIGISRDLAKEGYNKQALTEALIRISTDRGTGSGFLITSDGYAVTCNHVIKDNSDAIKARVRTKNSRGLAQDSEYTCALVFKNEDLDIAIIKLETKENNLPFTVLMPCNNEPQDYWHARKVHLLSYPFGNKFDDHNFFEGYISSYQEVNDIETLLLGIEGKCGSSGGMCIDAQSGFIIGIFCGSYIEKHEELTEEINYARPVKYLWDIFKQEPDRDKNRN